MSAVGFFLSSLRAANERGETPRSDFAARLKNGGSMEERFTIAGLPRMFFAATGLCPGHS